MWLLVRLCDLYRLWISLCDGEKKFVQVVADGILFVAELIIFDSS